MTRRKLNQRERETLPADVHADLVEALFGTVGSFLSGIVGGLLVPVIAWGRTQDPTYLGATIVMVILAAFRLVVLLQFGRTDRTLRRQQARQWERKYALGAVTFMLAIGVTASMLVWRAHDQLTTLYGIVITMGCVGAVAGRNASRPMIVHGQVLALCLPLAFTFLVSHGAWYWGLAIMLVLTLTSVKSTTRFLNNTLVAALLNGREASLQRKRFSTALDSMSHGLCMGDPSGAITVVNQRLIELFGLSPQATENCDASGLASLIAESGPLSAEERVRFIATWDEHVSKRDSKIFSAVIGERIFDFRCEPEEQGGFVMVASDVTEARLASQEIERMARFDSLTGLPNRSSFHAELTNRLDSAREGGAHFAVLSIDLDQFKEVNDNLGHAMGDKLLRSVGERLRKTLKSAEIIARFGGDEFQVLLSIGPNRDAAFTAAKKVVEELSRPYKIDGAAINIGASIGMAFAPDDAITADEILRCADMALYAAKAAGRGVAHAFDSGMEVALRRRKEISDVLRKALDEDDLILHYQPVVDALSGHVVACEALVRLPHPTEGMVPPGEFIAVAEESGLVVKLGEWVLRRACTDAMTWPESIRVAVNFSPRQFVLGSNVAEDIERVLKATGLPPHRLEVEITESTLIDAKDSLQQLKNISELGVKISLDDFGTGYSSLSYLRQFPVNKIKIDRSFALDIRSQASQAIIRSVSVLAKLLNVELVVEGVETKAQLEALTSWSVHLIQGYYYSKPMPVAQLMPMLTGSEGPAAPAFREVA